MSNTGLTRRDALKAVGLTIGAGALAGTAQGSARLMRPLPAVRSLRFVHMTDVHVQPELRAGEGLAACLKHIANMNDKPGLVVTGGDLVMDTFAQEHTRAAALWSLLTGSFKDGCGVEVRHALGNHDIWGWNKKKSNTKGTEQGWGKARALEALGMERAYNSFDRGAWHFITLDSINLDPRDPDGYTADLGAEQLDWLSRDLAEVGGKKPVVIVSHAPILSATVLLGDPKDGERKVSSGLLHADSAKIRALFAKHPNVKLCLSGHIHRLDRVEFMGVTYICDGAVCGAWWKGNNLECQEGYGVVDLFEDGTFKHEYVPYGWKAEKA